MKLYILLIIKTNNFWSEAGHEKYYLSVHEAGHELKFEFKIIN